MLQPKRIGFIKKDWFQLRAVLSTKNKGFAEKTKRNAYHQNEWLPTKEIGEAVSTKSTKRKNFN